MLLFDVPLLLSFLISQLGDGSEMEEKTMKFWKGSSAALRNHLLIVVVFHAFPQQLMQKHLVRAVPLRVV